MNKELKKRAAIGNFVDELWTSVAEGKTFEFSKVRVKHHVSSPYVSYIKTRCVTNTGSKIYKLKDGVSKTALVNFLADKTIKDMSKLLKPEAIIPAATRPTKISPNDIVTSHHRFDKVLTVSKLEAAAVIDKEVLPVATSVIDAPKAIESKPISKVRITISRTYANGHDESSFDTLSSKSHAELISEFKRSLV